MRHRGMLVTLVLALGCGASTDPAPPPATSGAAASGALTVRAEAGADRGHALVIENGTSAAMRLRREILVERQNGAAWEPVQASWLLLRTSCDPPEPPACVEIAPGTTFRARAWTDMIGDAQCACEECGPAGAGTYRFVVTECDPSTTRRETAPFAVE